MDSDSIEDQLACVRREIAMRKSCYPGWVTRGKMSQKTAEKEIATMRSVETTLERILNARMMK